MQKSLVKILKSRLAHLNEVCDKLEAERSTYELKYENLMADDEDRINEKKRAAEGQVDRIERLVSDQDNVIASAEDEESKSERAMEESKRQVKRLKDLKATAKRKNRSFQGCSCIRRCKCQCCGQDVRGAARCNECSSPSNRIFGDRS